MSDSDEATKGDSIDIERICMKGHSEARNRLSEIRSDEWIDRLEDATGFYEFAAATADAIRKSDNYQRP